MIFILSRLLFFLMIRLAPISTRTATLFPYTTLVRSPRGADRRLALPAAERAGEDRALLGHRGDGCGGARIVIRAQPRDRRPGVDEREEGTRAAELPRRHPDPRRVPGADRPGRHAHLPPRRPPPRQRQAAPPIRSRAGRDKVG